MATVCLLAAGIVYLSLAALYIAHGRPAASLLIEGNIAIVGALIVLGVKSVLFEIRLLDYAEKAHLDAVLLHIKLRQAEEESKEQT